MQKSDMLKIRNNRQDLVGFLYMNSICTLNKLFCGYYRVSNQSFTEICDKTLSLYSSKTLSNKVVSRIFEILADLNTSFKIESHRRNEFGEIFEYNETSNSYVFLKTGTHSQFKRLNHYL